MIDIEKFRVFDENITELQVNSDLDKYYITNIRREFDGDPEYLCCLGEALYNDYIRGMLNYKAYIDYGMNARMLMELRRSFLIRFDKEYFNFYTGHLNLSTQQEVKKFRHDYMEWFDPCYQDLNWQYFTLIKFIYGKRAKEFAFNYELCYEDFVEEDQDYEEDYKAEFFYAHFNDFDKDGNPIPVDLSGMSGRMYDGGAG